MTGQKSYWMDPDLRAPACPVPLDGRQVENIVIGGGMAGVLTAYFLHKSGREVILLEAETLGSGQTGGTTAKITCQHGLLYHRLIDTFGLARARQYADANRRAIDLYGRIAEAEGIDCGYRRAPSFLYTRVDSDALLREQEAAARLGIEAAVTAQTELPFEVRLALRFDGQALFRPLRFLYGAARHLEIYEHTRVQTVRDHEVQTTGGTVTGNNIIFACHYPFVSAPGYYFARLQSQRSYVLALENAQMLEGMYLGIDQSGLSLRMDGNRLLLGGGGHPTGQHRAGGSYDMLRKRAKELWPHSREAAAWSAQDCMTGDGVPYIGRYSSTRSNWLVATGFNKWGMTSSMAAAELLCGMICGRNALGRDIFSPQRFSPAAAVKQAVSIGLKSTEGLARRFLEGPRAEISELPRGHGGIVGAFDDRLGVYKDENGTVWAVDPVCPHMGCLLEWNPDEKSWDCPCHGSRFDYKGHLLGGPAQTALEPATCPCGSPKEKEKPADR
ncbi:MAG: FAD-dependent oxidoreductase [Butyricicoccaceae bacterium]